MPSDLTRILALPTRHLDPKDKSHAKFWTSILRKPEGSCNCKSCILELRPLQGQALNEVSAYGGLLGILGVGAGKTGISLLVPSLYPERSAVLLIPPQLKAQLIWRDLPAWRAHWLVRDDLHIITYSELSSPKSTKFFETLRPGLVVADEAHLLAHADAARTRRFLRYMREARPKFIPMSGTLTNRSLRDYAHLAYYALGEGSPLPIQFWDLVEWSECLDSNPIQRRTGALKRLCVGQETEREAFQRRLISTPGVVASPSEDIPCSLRLHPLPLKAPPELTEVIAEVRETWTRPDGEEFVENLPYYECLSTLSAGFYSKWIWEAEIHPLGIQQWKHSRSEWCQEIRERLKHAKPGMDSPALIEVAEGRRFTPSKAFLRWKYWREAIPEPASTPVWISDHLIEAVQAFNPGRPAIIWTEHPTVGERIAEAIKAPYFGADSDSELLKADGSRTIVASLLAHSEGKNLQAWDTMLVAEPISNGKRWEQVLGRCHRHGQKSDTVTCYYFVGLEAYDKAIKSARRDAQYIEETTGTKQKLLFADEETP